MLRRECSNPGILQQPQGFALGDFCAAEGSTEQPQDKTRREIWEKSVYRSSVGKEWCGLAKICSRGGNSAPALEPREPLEQL